MAKVVCESCETSFKYEVVKDLKNCPVCGKPLWESLAEDNKEEVLGFWEKMQSPDLYFYEIDDEEEYDNNDLRDVWCQCTSCKTVNTVAYNKFDMIRTDYVKLKENLGLTCKGCGKSIKNEIVPRRPDGWRDLNLWENIPKCPICSSTDIKKISLTNKAASALALGVLSAGHVSKTYKCNTCGAKF
ncbi:MAG: hypothetical protein HDR11_01230 [Lachnospiraceae bacterium]|nr:hypothetical protein [Lachnospiraceae bacterium]